MGSGAAAGGLGAGARGLGCSGCVPTARLHQPCGWNGVVLLSLVSGHAALLAISLLTQFLWQNNLFLLVRYVIKCLDFFAATQ